MKITVDTKNGEVKVNGKLLKDAPEHYKQIAEYSLRLAYEDNYPLNNYDEDSVWMSYRYCIGRHTIASHMRAGDIWKHCKGRMNKDRQLFTAFDINREIEQHMRFGKGPEWNFPLTSLNRIYTSAIDIFCEFLEDYNIKSKEDYLKYKKIDIILTDNERGYKFETVTWEETLRPIVHKIVLNYFAGCKITEDKSWEYYLNWKENPKDEKYLNYLNMDFERISKDIPNTEYFYFHDIEDLFVWNDLVHCFDKEHHHKSILTNGEEVEWFWTWTEKSEKHEDGYYYKAFGYKKIRVPVDKWNGSVTTWIPDESIEKDIY